MRQVDGVSTNLVTQTATNFNYYDSQIEAMLLHLPPKLSESNRQRVAEILADYGDRYG